MKQLLKKYMMLAIFLGLALISSAVLVVNHYTNKKVGFVSENPNIGYFIDTMMRNERNRILSVTSPSETTAKRLHALGFTSVAGLPVISKEDAECIKQLYFAYDSLYPTKQFVNFKCVDALMKTYNLSFGTVDRYIGTVPADRIDSMEAFKPNQVLGRHNWSGLFNDTGTPMDQLASVNMGHWNVKWFREFDFDKRLPGWTAATIGAESWKWHETPSKFFYILAPPSKFSGKVNSAGNYGPEIKDPIVLAPVQGGYLIVTAW
jgi:hypothetical protein